MNDTEQVKYTKIHLHREAILRTTCLRQISLYGYYVDLDVGVFVLDKNTIIKTEYMYIEDIT